MAQIDPASVRGGGYVQSMLPSVPRYGQQQGLAEAQMDGLSAADISNSPMPQPRKTSGDLNIKEAADKRPFLQKLLTAPLDLVEGVTQGLLEDPLLNFLSPVHWAYNLGAWATGLPSTKAIAAQIDEHTNGRTVADIGEIIGALAPSFAAGAGLYSLGRATAIKALAEGAASGRLLATTERVAGSEFVNAMKLERQLGAMNVRHNPTTIADKTFQAVTPPPFLERVVGEAGGAVGIGAAEAVNQGAKKFQADENFTLPQVATAAAEGFIFGTALAGAAGAALGGAAKVLGHATELSGGAIEARLFSNPKHAELVKTSMERGKKTLDTLRTSVMSRRDTVNQLKELQTEVIGQSTQAVTNLQTAVELFNSQARLPKLGKEISKAQEKLNTSLQSYRAQLTENKGVYRMLNSREPIPNQYTRLEPYNPEGNHLMLMQMYTKLLQRPEGLLRKMGVSGVRFLQEIGGAEHERLLGRSVVSKLVTNLRKDAIEILKPTAAETALGKSEFLSPGVEAFEKRGLQGVRNHYTRKYNAETGAKMVDWFKQIEDVKKFHYDRVVKLGARNYMTDEGLAEMGVAAFWPHINLRTSDKIMRARTMDALTKPLLDAAGVELRPAMTKAQAEIYISKHLLSGSKFNEHVQQFGSQDFRRVVKGTLASKVKQGQLLEPDPLLALDRYLNDIGTNHAYSSRFGYGDDARKAVKEAVLTMTGLEGGSIPLMTSVLDELMFTKFYPAAWAQTAQMLTSYQTGSKLAFSVISNLSGAATVPMVSGIGNTLKGLRMLVKDAEGTEYIRHAIAVHESLWASLRRSYIGQSIEDSFMDRFADMVLKVTGFNAVEKFNRLLSGAAAYASIMDDIAKGVAGRHKGSNLDTVRRRWEHMGMNYPDSIIKIKARMSAGGTHTNGAPITTLTAEEDLKTAMHAVLGSQVEEAIFKVARVTQGIPTVTTRPLAWSHPLGRVMTQFKSFSLNQGALIGERVVGEYAKGNPAPLAYMLSLYPVAGDMVRTANLAARNKDSEVTGLDRYVDDLSAVGGFGLTNQMLNSIKYGDLDSFILGPSYTTGENALGALYQLISTGESKRAEKNFNTTPIVQLTQQLYNGGKAMTIGHLEELARLDEAELTTSKRSPQKDVVPMFELQNAYIRGNGQ